MMIEAVRTSETSVNFYVTTLLYIPEDPKLQSTAMFGSFTFHMMSSNFSSCVLYTERLQCSGFNVCFNVK
jgi:hypothetical protein